VGAKNQSKVDETGYEEKEDLATRSHRLIQSARTEKLKNTIKQEGRHNPML